MARRTTLEEFIVKARAKHGDRYQYISLDFSKPPAKFLAVCEKHGEFTQEMQGHVSRGYGCQKCGNEAKSAAKRTPVAELVAGFREVHGDTYEYKDVYYKNTRGFVVAVCKEHGEFTQNIFKHKAGQNCPECAKKISVEKRRWTLPEVVVKATEVHKGLYEYVSLEIAEFELTKVVAVCKEHGEFTQDLARHLAGQGCPKCWHERRGESIRLSFEDFKSVANQVHENYYTYKEIYKDEGERTRAVVICPFHGEFTQIMNDHLTGHGCPNCAQRISQPNKDIYALFDTWGLDPVQEFRPTKSRKTFDVYVPSLKLAIEYNGNYWHSSKFMENNYHKAKSELAASAGMRLVHIFSHEWKFRKPAVVALLRRLAGKDPVKIAGRETEVVFPSKEEANTFLDLNHIQGTVRTGDFIGLSHKGDLCAVMVFNHNTSDRYAESDASVVELTRYASSSPVFGGFSKLLKAWLSTHSEVKTVVSYSDNRVFTGATYAKYGFEKFHETPPDYKYVEPGWDDTLHNKAKYQKSKLIERFGAEFCEGKTEKQITEQKNIYQVYDCGKTKWVLTT